MFRTSVLAAILLMLVSSTPVQAATQTVTFTKTVSFDDVTVTVSGTLTVDTTAKTLTGTVTVTVVNSTTGQTIVSKTFNINLSFANSNTVKFELVAEAIPLVPQVSCNVDTTNQSAVCTTSTSADVNGNGVVDLDDLIATFLTWGGQRPSIRFDFNNDGRVDVDDLLLAIMHWGSTATVVR